ncbi:MAG: serine/threonine protein kinase [Polyangiaceae bacterium]|nr:serine/threonine protein kinase [Polyangiaceae bacterium]
MQLDRIGKYRIIAKLGQGGMATVFLSLVPGPGGFNKLLVVKVLKEELSEDPEFLAMFLNEARLAARLNHANVVQTYEVGAEGRVHFIAMDYLDGQPLHAVLRKATRAGMPLDVHVRILADTCAGLHYAHTLRDFDGTPVFVVHRDVSPQNVFVTYDGQVKVVDFGIAKAVGAASTTQTGMLKGKMSYIAPEQAKGDAIDARADVFSVGVMLWEAMAASRFAHGDSQSAVLARRLSGHEPRIREVVPDADPELADICDKAMAQDPNNRYASAQALRDALEAFLDRFSRRVGSREVGELLGRLFAEDRDALRKAIDEQMKRVLRETSHVLPVPTFNVHQGGSDATPHSGRIRRHAFRDDPTVPEGRPGEPGEQEETPTSLSNPRAQYEQTPPSFSARIIPDHAPGSFSATPGTLATAHISQPPAAKKSGALPLLIALAGLAAASVSVAAFAFYTRKPATSEPAASAAAAGATASAAATDKIKLSITFGPAGTTAKLDGVPLLESPFVAHVVRDGSMHRIDVEGPGLESQTKMISFDKDVAIVVDLVPAAAGSANAAPSATSAPNVGTGRVPSGPLPKDPKGPREIDEADPYKKK